MPNSRQPKQIRQRAQPLRDKILMLLLQEGEHDAPSLSRALREDGTRHSLSGLYKAIGRMMDEGLLTKSRADASEDDVLRLLNASLDPDLNKHTVIDAYPKQYLTLTVHGRVLAGIKGILAVSVCKRPSDRLSVERWERMIERNLVGAS